MRCTWSKVWGIGLQQQTRKGDSPSNLMDVKCPVWFLLTMSQQTIPIYSLRESNKSRESDLAGREC